MKYNATRAEKIGEYHFSFCLEELKDFHGLIDAAFHFYRSSGIHIDELQDGIDTYTSAYFEMSPNRYGIKILKVSKLEDCCVVELSRHYVPADLSVTIHDLFSTLTAEARLKLYKKIASLQK